MTVDIVMVWMTENNRFFFYFYKYDVRYNKQLSMTKRGQELISTFNALPTSVVFW